MFCLSNCVHCDWSHVAPGRDKLGPVYLKIGLPRSVFLKDKYTLVEQPICAHSKTHSEQYFSPLRLRFKIPYRVHCPLQYWPNMYKSKNIPQLKAYQAMFVSVANLEDILHINSVKYPSKTIIFWRLNAALVFPLKTSHNASPLKNGMICNLNNLYYVGRYYFFWLN